MTDESLLIKSARRQDGKAFEALYRIYAGEVYTLALRMIGDPHGAEDITQEIFVRLWQKIGTFRGRSSFRTWLYRLSMNVIIRQRSRIRNHREVSLYDPSLTDGEDMSSRVALRLDLQRAVSSLPPRCRGVLVLHDLMGRTHPEIAEIMGISPGTSKAHLHKARNLLRKELKG